MTQTKFSAITKLLEGKVYAMVSVKSKEVHFAVKNDKYRSFVDGNRTVIKTVKFEGTVPKDEWLKEQGRIALENLSVN